MASLSPVVSTYTVNSKVNDVNNGATSIKLLTSITALPAIKEISSEDKAEIRDFASQVTSNTLQIRKLHLQLAKIQNAIAEFKTTALNNGKKEEIVQVVQNNVLNVMNSTYANLKELEEINKAWEDKFNVESKKITELQAALKDKNKLDIKQTLIEELRQSGINLKEIEDNIKILMENKKEVGLLLVKLENTLRSNNEILKINQQKIAELEQKLQGFNGRAERLEQLSLTVTELRNKLAVQVIAIDKRLINAEIALAQLAEKDKKKDQIIGILDKNFVEMLKIIKAKNTEKKMGLDLLDLIERNENELSKLKQAAVATTTPISEAVYLERESALNNDLAKKAALAELLNQRVNLKPEDVTKLLDIQHKAIKLIKEINLFKPNVQVDKEVLQGKNSLKQNIYDRYVKENAAIFVRIEDYSQKYLN